MDNLRFLSEIALSFQNINNFDRDMNKILEKIGNYIHISRVYVFLNENKDLVSNAFEWCNIGIEPQIQHLQDFNYTDMPSFRKMLINDGFICSADISELADDIVAKLEPQEIKSIVAYPLIIKKKIIGFIGFDECNYNRIWQEEELEILNTISRLVSSTYEIKFDKESLISSENNFRNFFETTEDMFMVTGPNHEILYCNRALIEKLQYSLEELKTMHILELHPANKRKVFSKKIKSMLAKEISHGSLEFESKFGRIYTIDTKVWSGKWNNMDCVFSISKDITKEIENYQLFSTIFDNNPLPMTIHDIDTGNFIKTNSAFINTTGYLSQDVKGKSIKDLDIFIDSEEMNSILRRQYNKEKINNEKLIIKCKDGTLLTGLFSIEEVISEGKKALLVVMIDITKRVELTKSVEDKCQKLTNIIEGTNLGTWEWDVQTGAVEFNEEWANMLGYTLEELKPTSVKTWDLLIHPDDLVTSNNVLEKHLKGTSPNYDCEVRMKHKDGSWLWKMDHGCGF